MTDFPVLLEGATVNYLPMSQFLSNNARKPGFKCPFPLFNFDKVVVCGGADGSYDVQNRCRWWNPATDEWKGDTRLDIFSFQSDREVGKGLIKAGKYMSRAEVSWALVIGF